MTNDSPFTHIQGHIPWSKIDIWLQGFRSIWISTTRPDGRPHAVPVWFIWEGESVYFATDKNSQKVKNLAAQPSIIVHAGDGDDVIIIEGKAGVITDPATTAQINERYMQKYVDPHSGAQATISESDTLYQVTADRLMCWEYGVVATRTDWERRVPPPLAG